MLSSLLDISLTSSFFCFITYNATSLSMAFGTLLRPPSKYDISTLKNNISRQSRANCASMKRSLASWKFARGTPTERQQILRYAIQQESKPLGALAWLNVHATHSEPSSNSPAHVTVHKPRSIQSHIALSKIEMGNLWSIYAPHPIAKELGKNMHWRSWMTNGRTNWNEPAMLRLILTTGIRYIESMLERGSCAHVHVLQFLTAVLCLQSGITHTWVQQQLPFLDKHHVKSPIDAYYWRPFYHQLSNSLLRVAAVKDSETRKTLLCSGCKALMETANTSEAWIHPTVVANVVVQNPPPHFSPMLALIEQNFYVPMTESIILAYLSCWALTELDFAAIINGFNHRLSLEECILHAHQIFLMYKRCVSIPHAKQEHSVSFFGLMIEACYILGAVADAWAIFKLCRVPKELPSHTLYVVLDLRNHLPEPEDFIPLADYTKFVWDVFVSVTTDPSKNILNPSDMLLLTKLCTEIRKHHAILLQDTARVVEPLFHMLEIRLSLSIQTDPTCEKQHMLPMESTVVNFIEVTQELVLSHGCNRAHTRLMAILEDKGACKSQLPAAMLLECALRVGLNKEACALYLRLPKEIQKGIIENVDFKLLDMLYLAMKEEAHHTEETLIQGALQKRRKTKPTTAQIEQMKEAGVPEHSYQVVLDFDQFLPLKAGDEEDSDENLLNNVYW